jgi:hypothetical protein
MGVSQDLSVGWRASNTALPATTIEALHCILMDPHQVDPRLPALDRWISNLRLYDKIPLALSLALLVTLPIALMNLATRSFLRSFAPSSRRAVIQDGSFLVPHLIHTTEVSIMACKNVGRSPETARAVATSRVIELVSEYAVTKVPKLVFDSLEEQIRRYYDLAAPVTLDPLEVYNCEAQ